MRQSSFNVEGLESRVLMSASPARIVVGYFPDYEWDHYNKANLQYLSQVNYFSVLANSNGTLPTVSRTNSDPFTDQLTTLVADAHSMARRVSVNLVVDVNSPFQTIADNATARGTLGDQLLSYCQTYNLDGIDMDYEPGGLSQTQRDNYELLLNSIHTKLSAHGYKLSAAVQASATQQGQQVIEQNHLDDIDQYNLMDYDLEPGAAAPIGDANNDATAYVNQWLTYGVPASKLVMGMPFYGRGATSWSETLPPDPIGYGDLLADYANAHNHQLPPTTLDSITTEGFHTNDNGTVVDVGPHTFGFDSVHDEAAKITLVNQDSLAGMMIWSLGGDYFTGANHNVLDSTYSLLPLIAAGMGVGAGTTAGPAVPSTPDLAVASDTGSSSTDNITKTVKPTFTGTADAGSVVSLYLDGGSTSVGSVTATNGTWSITLGSNVAEGAHTITAKAAASGTTSAASSALNFTVDTTAPTVAANYPQLDWVTGPQRLRYNFSETVNMPLGAGLTADYTLTKTGTGGGSVPTSATFASNTLTITWPTYNNNTGRLKTGSYQSGVSTLITDVAGNAMPTNLVGFSFLEGDANRNGTVDVSDFTTFFANFGRTSGANYNNGDFDYSGTVDVADFTIFFANFGAVASIGTPVSTAAAKTQSVAAKAAVYPPPVKTEADSLKITHAIDLL